MAIITIKQVLDEMATGQPFTLSFVTYDRKRKKGGELREVEAILETPTGPEESNRPLTQIEQKLQQIHLSPENTKAPNHRQWYTRNIRLTCDGYPSSEVRKVHPPLFVTFNGKTVVP